MMITIAVSICCSSYN